MSVCFINDYTILDLIDIYVGDGKRLRTSSRSTNFIKKLIIQPFNCKVVLATTRPILDLIRREILNEMDFDFSIS